MRKYLSFLVLGLIVLSFLGCSSQNKSEEYDSEAKYDYNESVSDDMDQSFGESSEEEMVFNEAMSSNEVKENISATRKLIKSASIDLETLEFDSAIETLKNQVEVAGGYIESSNVNGKSMYNEYARRNAYFTLRIPSEHFMSFKNNMNTVGNVLSTHDNTQDVTSSYFDTEARLKTLQIQEERLLDILSKAEVIEDVIALERELSNVRYEIENFTGTLKKYDNLINYSTLSVSISEVFEITVEEERAQTIGEKISQQFKRSVNSIKEFLEDGVVYGIGRIPFLIFWIPGLIIAFYIFKKLSKKSKQRNVNNVENVSKDITKDNK